MLAPVLALAMFFSPESIQKGTALFQDCVDDVRYMDYPTDPRRDLDAAQRCSFYIGGFLDARGGAESMACAGSTTFDGMIRNYVRYMREHPVFMTAHRAVGLRSFLLETCRTSK